MLRYTPSMNDLLQKRTFSGVLILSVFLFFSAQLLGQGQSNANRVSVDLSKNDSKIEGIISKMTLEEKIAMLHGNGMFTSPGLERSGIPELRYTDGPFGIREELEKNSWNPMRLTTDSATFFPTGSALAATWNPDLAYLQGTGMGEEARSRGKDVLLGPAVNITRVPTNGRTFEYLSEDPFLNSRLTVGYIRGVQDRGVASCVKHFALNNQETNRNSVNVIIDDRAMREIYLPAFEAAVKEANAFSVMAAYNRIDGKYCSESEMLLNQILRKEWGFRGMVISDWGGTHSTVGAAMSGLDVEMGTMGKAFFGQPLLDSVKAGLVPIGVINDKVKNILRIRFAVEPVTESQSKGVVSTPEHGEIAYKIASQSIVLLKNAGNLLPVDLNKVRKIAVIGDNATRKLASGGFGAGVKTKYEITPLAGLKSRVGSRATLQFAQGYKPSYIQGRGGRTPGNVIDSALLSEAVNLARNSDIAIIFAGTNREFETEGTDRSDLKLPFGQDELIRKISAVNPRTIVVLVAGAPLDLNEALKYAPAILISWFNGSEGGNALADVLLGKINPSGKLPFTFPVSLNDSPAYALGSFPGDNNSTDYKEGSLVGYRWFETKNIKPLFSFGYGLSYTEFFYKGLKTDKKKYKGNETIQVSLELKNTGKREGDEVVQLYVHRTGSKVEWPAKELKGFTRVTLKAGETRKVTISLPVSQLRYWDVKSNDWKLEDGKIELMIGSSSTDIHLTRIIEI